MSRKLPLRTGCYDFINFISQPLVVSSTTILYLDTISHDETSLAV